MRDVIGNELKVGDLVAIQLERPVIFGQVVEINEGAVLMPVDGIRMEPQPGRAVIMCKQVVMFDPRVGNCGAVMALRDDAGRVKIGSEKETSDDQALPN